MRILPIVNYYNRGNKFFLLHYTQACWRHDWKICNQSVYRVDRLYHYNGGVVEIYNLKVLTQTVDL